jgi:hypothetical protein
LHNADVRRHAQSLSVAGEPLPHRHFGTVSISAVVLFMSSIATPCSARSDWNIGTEASVRHDDNVGNAENADDIVADTIVAARLSLFQSFAVAESYSFTVAGDLSGEHFNRLDGLNNASVDASFALKKKWGLGAFAPWARATLSVARSHYDDNYRSAWIYRAALASGRRIDERWNVWIDYAFERNTAINRLPEVTPGLSSDVFGGNNHNLAFTVQYSLIDTVALAIAAQARSGDVVSTTSPGAQVYYASRAVAEDETFGSEYYAYKLRGTSYGFRVGINYSPSAHSLIGGGFRRIQTHAQGGNNYTKSIPELTWDYRF